MAQDKLKADIRQLWNWSDPISRMSYLAIGLVLLAIKIHLDRYLLLRLSELDRSAGIRLTFDFYRLADVPKDETTIYGVLLLASLPFLYLGLMLTVRRMRSVGLSPWFSLLLFVPGLNVLLVLFLCILPPETSGSVGERMPWLDRLIPDDLFGSAAMSILLIMPPAVLVVTVITEVFHYYGPSLFFGVPFVVGCGSVFLYGYHEQRSVHQSILVSCCSIFMLGLFLLVFALEGIICLIVVSPMALVFGGVAGVFGHALQALSPARTWMLLFLFLSLPLVAGLEKAGSPGPPELEVTSSVVVDAPPETVWKHLASSTKLPPPDHWMFDMGIGYPIWSRLDETGKGSKRRCKFSTGVFVEDITTWNPPDRLAFTVRKHPPAMKELSPYGPIDTPHQDNFYYSTGGEFRLRRLSQGRTRLSRTTWYHLNFHPVAYWRLWTDRIVHQIHLRVLRHIRRQAEMDGKR